MSWRIETANPATLLGELPDKWAQTCFLRPPRVLPAPCLLLVLEQTHRVLRDDGTLWLTTHANAREIEAAGWLTAEHPARTHIAPCTPRLFSKQPDFHFNPRAPLPPNAAPTAQACPNLPGTRARVFASRRASRRAWCVPATGALSASVIRWCILAGSSPRACGVCGSPWKRHPARAAQPARWLSDCPHSNGGGRCLVLDPFCRSATVGQAAVQLGRSYLGIVRHPGTAGRARRRIQHAEQQEPTR
jgi:hypothetical protein